MESATVRVRPLRFAFVVEPKDKASLQRIFEVNSSLWGGVFNFIIPLFKQVPSRYREKYFKTPPAKAILKGLVEAFQPAIWLRSSLAMRRLTESCFLLSAFWQSET